MNIIKSVCKWVVMFTIVVLAGCDSSEDLIEPEVVFEGVDSELVPYFERFQEEGLKRGYSFDLKNANIRGVIREIEENHIAGRCSYSSFNPRLVTVDKTFWERSSNNFREFIVFHELGHCFLNRDHLEEAFDNGVCVSIMRSGNGTCYDQYTSQFRSYYLDELFSQESLK